jgi:hypothetical protein
MITRRFIACSARAIRRVFITAPALVAVLIKANAEGRLEAYRREYPAASHPSAAEFGSPGRTRTSDQAVNSRLLPYDLRSTPDDKIRSTPQKALEKCHSVCDIKPHEATR